MIEFHGTPALDFGSAKDLTTKHLDDLSLNISIGAEKFLIDYKEIGSQYAVNANRETPIIGGKVVITALSIKSGRLIKREYIAQMFRYWFSDLAR